MLYRTAMFIVSKILLLFKLQRHALWSGNKILLIFFYMKINKNDLIYSRGLIKNNFLISSIANSVSSDTLPAGSGTAIANYDRKVLKYVDSLPWKNGARYFYGLKVTGLRAGRVFNTDLIFVSTFETVDGLINFYKGKYGDLPPGDHFSNLIEMAKVWMIYSNKLPSVFEPIKIQFLEGLGFFGDFKPYEFLETKEIYNCYDLPLTFDLAVFKLKHDANIGIYRPVFTAEVASVVGRPYRKHIFLPIINGSSKERTVDSFASTVKKSQELQSLICTSNNYNTGLHEPEMHFFVNNLLIPVASPLVKYRRNYYAEAR